MELFVRPIARGSRIFRLSLIFVFYLVQSGRKRKEFTLMNQIRSLSLSLQSVSQVISEKVKRSSVSFLLPTGKVLSQSSIVLTVKAESIH